MERLESLRQPTIAALNGIAYGGGLELALACDLRLAADHVKLAAPEVGIATVPGWGMTTRLATVVGPARAKQMILTGLPIDAERAASWGVVSEVVPAADLDAATDDLAARIAAQAPVAVQVAKQLIDATRPRTSLEALGGGSDRVHGRRSRGPGGVPRTTDRPSTEAPESMSLCRKPGPPERLRGPGGGSDRLRRRPGQAARDDAARTRSRSTRSDGRWHVEDEAWTNWTEGFLGGLMLDHRPPDGRRLVARAGRALQPPDRATQGRPHRPRPRVPVHLDLEALVRGDGRSGQVGHGRPRRTDDGPAVQREGPLPALVRLRRLVLHRHHDERRDHLRSRSGDGRRGPPADRHRALPDHPTSPRAR